MMARCDKEMEDLDRDRSEWVLKASRMVPAGGCVLP
jgi:hypothetical protein